MKDKNIVIRREEEKDRRAVEHLVRESFWNVYRPGCYEHFVLHKLRSDPAFVQELDLVMEKDGQLIGQNMFMRAVIRGDDGALLPIMTMGPRAAGRSASRATSSSTARAALPTPGNSASATTTCRRGRTIPSSSAGS